MYIKIKMSITQGCIFYNVSEFIFLTPYFPILFSKVTAGDPQMETYTPLLLMYWYLINILKQLKP